MAVERHNILQDSTARQQFVQGVKLLKQEASGVTTGQLNLPGRNTSISTYDLFVAWHHAAMNEVHSRPVFLPWHRYMLILLEQQLQRVLNDPQFGLPYWDWAADGTLSVNRQASAPIWKDDCMGGQGNPVASGPFAFNAADPASWRVRLVVNVGNQLGVTNRGLRRAFRQNVSNLPTKQQVAVALNQTPYDRSPWDRLAAGFRNRVEGWLPASLAPGLHNRVHVWVGGDMLPSSSPNDPVFYLNHCNEDRIWSAWLQRHGVSYLPPQTAPVSLRGQRIDDMMNALFSPPTTPRDMLDVSDIYTYDSLAVA